MGGIIVTFASWRIIFWVQTAMAGFGLILSLLFVSGTQDPPKMRNKGDQSDWLFVLNMFNPLRIIRQFVYPNIFLAVCFATLHMECLGSTLLTNFDIKVPHLRFSGHFSVHHHHLCTLPFQPPIPPHHSPGQRSLLPRPGLRLLPGQRGRRQAV